MHNELENRILGLVFGYLRIVSFGDFYGRSKRPFWRAVCDQSLGGCGFSILVDTKTLTRKDNPLKSCGCMSPRNNSKDLSGYISGRLRVISESERRGQYGAKYWLCFCDPGLEGCGKYYDVLVNRLIAKKTTSCGCKNREITAKRNEPKYSSPFHAIGKQLKDRMEKIGYEYCLTDEFLEENMTKPCYYCGTPPSLLYAKRAVYNGLDRADNLVGYTPVNSVPCCKFCNKAKWAYGQDVFLAWIQRIRSYSLNITQSKFQKERGAFDPSS